MRDCGKILVLERFCSAEGLVNYTAVRADESDLDSWAGMRLRSPSLSYPHAGC